MNEENEYLEEMPDSELVRDETPRQNAPNSLLYDAMSYLTASPKARPHVVVQRDINAELRRGGLSTDDRKWLIEQKREEAREIERNTPPDDHPYRRTIAEAVKICAFGFTAVCLGTAYRLLQKS